MRGSLATLGVALFLVGASVAPAAAGVAGDGSGTTGGTTDGNTAGGKPTITTTTKTVWTADNITRKTVDVIDRYLTKVTGVGTTDQSWTSGTDYYFRHETTVARSNAASAVAQMKASLNNEVYSVGGRTYQYNSSQSYSGPTTILTSSDTSTTLDSVSSSTASKSTITKSSNAVIIGDLDNLENAFIAQGTVSKHTDITVTKTNNKTETTTRHYDNVDYYQVNVSRVISPIVLDLDGDGKIQASNGEWLPHPERFHQERLALFDFYGNGFPLMTEWVGPNDGLLCLPDEDGKVDGTRLFGTTTGHQDGYAALSVLDGNTDGKLTGVELEGLQVWQDADGDARAQASELKTVQELGITSLDLQHRAFASSFTRDGKKLKMVDWWPNVVELRKKDMRAH